LLAFSLVSAVRQARRAVREPRVSDRLVMLHDVIKLRGGSWDQELYKSMCVRADLLHAKRNLIAHGMWFHHKSGEWHVQLTRGSWPKDTADLVAGSKKVTPESIVITIDELRSATTQISALIDDLKKLRTSATAGRPPLPRRYP
jgi:hypothetical protein